MQELWFAIGALGALALLAYLLPRYDKEFTNALDWWIGFAKRGRK